MRRVLHLSTESNWGGGEQQVLSLIKELARIGAVEQTLLCSHESALEHACNEHGIPVRSVQRSLLSLLSWIKMVRNIVRTEQIELIHAHDSRAHGIAVLSNVSQCNPTPIVVHRRVGLRTQPTLSALWKYNHGSVRRVICISSFVQDRLDRIVLDRRKLVLIPSAIDRQRFGDLQPEGKSLRESLELPMDSRLIVNIGSLREQKQQSVFVRMAQVILNDVRLQREPLYFLIIGTGPEQASLQKQINQAGLQERIRLVGFLKNVPLALTEAEVLVSTAVDEAFGNVILEAFASRVAVVAARSGGVLDLLEPGATGFAALPGESRSFAEHVGRLLLDSSLRERIVERAYESLRKFDIAEVGARILKVYDTAALEKW